MCVWGACVGGHMCEHVCVCTYELCGHACVCGAHVCVYELCAHACGGHMCEHVGVGV